MGIKNLKHLITTYCSSAITTKQLSEYTGKIFAIDCSIYLYKFLYNNSDHLDGFVRQVLRLLKNGILPVFVFDGRPPKEKSSVLKNRKDRKANLIEKKDLLTNELKKRLTEGTCCDSLTTYVGEEKIEEDTEECSLELQTSEQIKKELDKVNKKIISITQEHIDKLITLFGYMGVPYIVANGEAEALCSKLSKINYVNCCVSEDTDILPNGGRYFIRNFNPDKNYIEEYSLLEILDKLNITYEQFLDLCILCGCDYTPKIHGIGPITAFKFIKSYGDLENIVDFITKNNKYTIPDKFDYKKARHLFVHSCDDCDFIEIKNKIVLTKPNINELVKFLEINSPKLKQRYYNEINKKLMYYIYNIKKDRNENVSNLTVFLKYKKKNEFKSDIKSDIKSKLI